MTAGGTVCARHSREIARVSDGKEGLWPTRRS